MEIIVGKTAGFCYGVKNAVNNAEKELEKEKNIYCLGEIVHNKTVIEELEKKGMIFTNNINDVNNKVIIRAHGETKQTIEELEKNNIQIIDLTCPNVIKIHELVKEYFKNNYYIILIGIKNHPEANATISYIEKDFYLIQEKEDIQNAIIKINKSNLNDILIMSQTTYNSKKFDEIANILKEELKEKNVVVKKTICGATEIRQEETMKIAKNVECMIIVGDKKSSNTNKLYDISKQYCKKAIFIQSVQEIEKEKLKVYKKIGVMAGASTPNKDIQEVIKELEG